MVDDRYRNVSNAAKLQLGTTGEPETHGEADFADRPAALHEYGAGLSLLSSSFLVVLLIVSILNDTCAFLS